MYCLSINATKYDDVTHTCCYLLNCREQCSSLNAYDSACNLHVASRHVTKHFTIESLTRCYITLFRLAYGWSSFFVTTFGDTRLSEMCAGYKPRLFLNFSRLETDATCLWYTIVITIVYKLGMFRHFDLITKLKCTGNIC